MQMLEPRGFWRGRWGLGWPKPPVDKFVGRADLVAYSRFNLEIYSLRKCYEIEKRSGVYTDVHEHRIAEVKAFAAL
jgi:hypothetical protein